MKAILELEEMPPDCMECHFSQSMKSHHSLELICAATSDICGDQIILTHDHGMDLLAGKRHPQCPLRYFTDYKEENLTENIASLKASIDGLTKHIHTIEAGDKAKKVEEELAK